MKPTRNIALQTKDAAKALAFYQNIMGLTPSDEMNGALKLGPMNLIIDDSPEQEGPVFEFEVDDLEVARERLVAAGCTVLRWEGRGGDCFLQDPHGLTFNLWQEEAS